MKLIELHDSIFKRLRQKVDSRIEIFDYLPPKEKPPFVVIGETQYDLAENLESKDDEGYVVKQKIAVVTEAMERHQALEILRDMRKAFKEDLSIEGSFLLRQKLRGGKVEETEDGFYVGVMNVDFWLLDEEDV